MRKETSHFRKSLPKTRIAVLIAFSATSIPLSQARQSAERAQEREPEIVITAKKMRTVRLHYTNTGPHLRRCDVLISSGERRIDDMVCEILRACVRQGQSDLQDAHICVNNRIGILERQNFVLAADSGSDSEMGTGQPPSVAIEPEPLEEVTVTARKPITSGLWQFEEKGARLSIPVVTSFSMNRAKFLRTSRWRLCIKPDEIETILPRMIDKDITTTPKSCRWQLQVEGSHIKGEQRCNVRHARTVGILEGEHSPNEIIVTKQLRFKEPGGGGSEMDLWFETKGERIGGC